MATKPPGEKKKRKEKKERQSGGTLVVVGGSCQGEEKEFRAEDHSFIHSWWGTMNCS
jgi:hypothetical protein